MNELARLRAFIRKNRDLEPTLREAADLLPTIYSEVSARASLNIWPSPVAGVGMSSAMLSWQNAEGHLEVEVFPDLHVELFVICRDPAVGFPPVIDKEWSAWSDAVAEDIAGIGRRVFRT